MAENDIQVVEPNEEKQRPIGDIMADYVTADAKSIGYNVLANTVIPGVLDVVRQALSSALDEFIHPYGPNNTGIREYRYSRSQPNASRADRYHNSYKANGAVQATKERRELDRIEAVHSTPIYNEDLAKYVILEMRQDILKSGNVTVAQFYDYSHTRTPISNDWDWGWTDLTDRMKWREYKGRDENGVECWYIRLPRAQFLKS